MGSVTALAKPHKANKEVNRINGIMIFFGTTGMDSECFII
jgi:hypothetical protein